MNKPLTVEINGTGTHNRGAELMAIAIAARLRAKYPGVRIGVPSVFGSDLEVKKHDFLKIVDEFSRNTARFCTILRGLSARRSYGLARSLNRKAITYRNHINTNSDVILPQDIDFTLDASGFAFSDQWGIQQAKRLYYKLAYDRQHNGFAILPQALGPFEDPAVKKWVTRLVKKARLCFARDNASYHHLAGLQDTGHMIRMSPDFTLEVPPLETNSIHLPPRFVAIVPNIRMIDMNDNSSGYLQFLKLAIDFLDKRNLTCLLVLHDSREDRRVITLLGDAATRLQLVEHSDPRVLKWVLSNAEFVIASRFHALVSAFSSGVPCVGAGWSHKYRELFADFNCIEFLVPDFQNQREISSLLERMTDETNHGTIKTSLLAAKDAMQEQVNEMWQSIYHAIDTSLRSQR